MSQTPLSRLLVRLEMADLAAELGVSRATLFRWVGASHTRGPQRITETFVYAIAGVTPDPAKVRQAIRSLLRD